MIPPRSAALLSLWARLLHNLEADLILVAAWLAGLVLAIPQAGGASSLCCAALTVGRVLCTGWWCLHASLHCEVSSEVGPRKELAGLVLVLWHSVSVTLLLLIYSQLLLQRLVMPPHCAALLSLLGASSAQSGGVSACCICMTGHRGTAEEERRHNSCLHLVGLLLLSALHSLLVAFSSL